MKTAIRIGGLTVMVTSIAGTQYNFRHRQGDNRQCENRAHENSEPRHEPAPIRWRTPIIARVTARSKSPPGNQYSRQRKKECRSTDQCNR